MSADSKDVMVQVNLFLYRDGSMLTEVKRNNETPVEVTATLVLGMLARSEWVQHQIMKIKEGPKP